MCMDHYVTYVYLALRGISAWVATNTAIAEPVELTMMSGEGLLLYANNDFKKKKKKEGDPVLRSKDIVGL